ncbi:hypothetical protein DPEC_G00098300 [Dallia pectoralis]|uniref:Uncharacterized protein n=1 Tax=Dallia pectoralis TaxID=75939 RepID=A0ACC2GW48_DALPE|nr:hypothetical protein DPEC_G00098300 [Dallia pectoralis]
MGCVRRLVLRPRVFRLAVLVLFFLVILLLNRYLLNPSSPSGLHRTFLQSRHIRSYPILTQPRCNRLQPARPKAGPSLGSLGPLSNGSSHNAGGTPCQGACPSPNSSPIFLLLAIKSHPADSARRAAVRATWGRVRVWKGETVSRVFLLGVEEAESEHGVREESNRYGDILQWSFIESFFNVTLKEVLFWNWFQQECSQTVLYVLKGDDDVYVDVERIVGLLQGRESAMGRRKSGEIGQEMESSSEPARETRQGTKRLNETKANTKTTPAAPTQPLYMGHVFVDTHPVRIWWNKYYVPYSLYTGPYPPYTGGGGYLLCREALSRLHQASARVSLFPIDDAFVGLVAQAANISATHHPDFMPVEYSHYKHPCNYAKRLMVLHQLLPHDLLHLWSFLQTQGQSCKQPGWDRFGWKHFFSGWIYT